MDDKVSRLLVLSPDSEFSPSFLARCASNLCMDVFIKQTCYGILVEGNTIDVDHVVEEIKKIDPNKIFTKIRAFPLGDKRRCRAQRGSARPGFYFLQKEIELLPNITKGLECLDETEIKTLGVCKEMEPKDFKRILEEMVIEND